MNRDRHLDFTLLNIGYAEHHADWNWKNINSPFARLHLVLKGSAKIVRDGHTTELRQGYLYLTPSYTSHGYECEDDFFIFYLHVYESPEKRSSIFNLLNFPVEVQGDELVVALIKRLYLINPGRELPFYDPSDYDNSTALMRNIATQKSTPIALELESQAIIQQVLSRFLALAEEKVPDLDDRIARVLDYIHSHIDAVIPIDRLAEIAFLTKDHLIRLFKKQLNCTPRKYINRLKIEKAQLMLLVGDCSIQQLAFQLGFDSVFYFNRLFRKLTGENPSTYKKRFAPVVS